MKLLTPSLTVCAADGVAAGAGAGGSGGDAFGFLTCLLFMSVLGLTVAFGTAGGIGVERALAHVPGSGTTGGFDCVGGVGMIGLATAEVGAAGVGSAGLALVCL